MGTTGPMSLAVASSATGPRRDINVTPLRSEFSVREWAWIQDHRTQASNPRVAKSAIFISPISLIMGPNSFFVGSTRKRIRKLSWWTYAGTVVAIPASGFWSGSVALRRAAFSTAGGLEGIPNGLVTGPKIAITNAATASDGDQFACFFNETSSGPSLENEHGAASVASPVGSLYRWRLCHRTLRRPVRSPKTLDHRERRGLSGSNPA